MAKTSKRIEAEIEKLEDNYEDRRQKYLKFVETQQPKQPREKAVEWFKYYASECETYGDQEVLVFLRSRGWPCTKEIKNLVSFWEREAKHEIEKCVKGSEISYLDTGKIERRKGIPLEKASDIASVNTYILPNFWGYHDDQEFSINATMLRTVEWCNIRGFDAWWHRLARTTIEEVIQGGVDPLPASYWLFSMCRSNFAISLMRKALERVLEAIELPLFDNRNPFRAYRQWTSNGESRSAFIDHIPHAASVVFSHNRLRGTPIKEKICSLAESLILESQDEDGSWRCWRDSKTPDMFSTTFCIHALWLARPCGWKKAIKRGAKWLWSKQHESGCWVEPGMPDPAYLSVLVMDAINMAEGNKELTFKHINKRTLRAKKDIGRRFAVALSFPGEIRELVYPVAKQLAKKLGREKVFYDKFYEAELARPNLDIYLQNIYHKEADLVVVFVCSGYEKKEWCGIEWRAIREMIKSRRDANILLMKTDSSILPGIFSFDGFVDISGRSPSKISEVILSRILINRDLIKYQ